MRMRAIGFALLAGAVAISTAACSDNGTGTAIVTTGPSSATTWVSATISSPMITPQAPFVYQSNVTTGVRRSAHFNIIVAASRTVTMSSATVHLTDGTNVGGPSVTFPQPELTSLFGSTLIVAGTTRPFVFNPFFGPSLNPFGLSANLTFFDLSGMSNTIFVSTPIR
jgi:hypothetical protein